MAKRSEIAVGQEWAYGRNRYHGFNATRGYNKVTILSTEPYRQLLGPCKTEKGQGVLVRLHTSWINESASVEKVIQLRELWIPWAEYETGKVEYGAERKIAMAQNAIIKAERQKYQQEVYQPALRAFQSAYQEAGFGQLSSYSRVEEAFKVEALEFLTKALQEVKAEKVA
jgi:hypothetical protein